VIGVPLTGTVEIPLRLDVNAAPSARDLVCRTLAGLPSVLRVTDGAAGAGEMRITARALLALLSELPDALPADADFAWTAVDGLTIRLPHPRSVDVAEPVVAAVGERAPRRRPAWVVLTVLLVGSAVLIGALTLLGRTTWAPRVEPSRSAAEQRPAPSSVPASVPASTPSPAPSAVPSAVSSAVLLAVPTPGPPRVVEVERPLDSVCLMPPGRQPCDAAGRARWDGDLAAWRAAPAPSGQAVPDERAAFQEATNLRLQMGDPPTRIQVARTLGWPAVFIAGAAYLSTGDEHDVHLEIANLGAAADDLSGARLVDGRGDTLLVLPPGATLAAGVRCRLTTGPPTVEPCTFSPAAVRRPRAGGPTPLTLRRASGEVLDALDPLVSP
jgi:hypothetical protein